MEDPIRKKRKIIIAGPNNQGNINVVKEGLMKKEGIISVDVDGQKNMVSLEYYLRVIKFEAIEKYIKDLGFSLSRKLIERFKRGMAKFTEQNELDNLNAPVSSCCEDPKGNSQGSKRNIP